jgi:HAMP domain-containing protein
MRLKLRTKFTLALSLIFLGGILAAWLIFSQLMQRHAEDIMTTRSLALIETMNSVRHYTSSQINPLLQSDLAVSEAFIPQTVPAYSARAVFEQLRSRPGYEAYQYKEATLNPTNPLDLADPFETGIVEHFRAQPDTTTLSGFTEVNGQQVFYNARPLRVSSEACLACHSTPENAPASLLATYGADGGFGWQNGEIIAAQIIYVPAADVVQNAQTWVGLIMLVVAIIFAVVILVMNFLLKGMVIRPVEQIAATATLISNDEWSPTSGEIATVSQIAGRGDELGATASVFERMAKQVYEREQRLKAELKRLIIQIDEQKREREVREITETDYFHELQRKARELRAAATMKTGQIAVTRQEG